MSKNNEERKESFKRLILTLARLTALLEKVRYMRKYFPSPVGFQMGLADEGALYEVINALQELTPIPDEAIDLDSFSDFQIGMNHLGQVFKSAIHDLNNFAPPLRLYYYLQDSADLSWLFKFMTDVIKKALDMQKSTP